METIREYLNSIFANLPATDDVLRAKQELLTMMEDKFGELMQEGKSESEAVEIIKEEFGNLDEIADSLGLHRAEDDADYRRYVSTEEAKDFISSHTFSRFMLGTGVMFCILCVVGPILSEGLAGFFRIGAVSKMVSAFSITSLFIFIAIGVGLIILSSAREKEWRFLKDELCFIDSDTESYVKSELDGSQVAKGLTLAAGIVLCSLSVLPTVLLEIIFSNGFITANLAPALLFVIAGIGVLLIISSTGKTGACRMLLNLNTRESLDEELSEDETSGNKEVKIHVSVDTEKKTDVKDDRIMNTWEKETAKTAEILAGASEKTSCKCAEKAIKASKAGKAPNGREISPLMDTILTNYWAIVFAIFMIGGFVFGLWGRMWLIWIIAPIVHSYLKKSYGMK